MLNCLLLSSAYSWFVGLLVMMVVLAVLFVAIAVAALKPVRMDDGTTDSQYAKRLLEKREAELLTEYQSKQGDAKAADEVMAKLRDVATAEKVVDELLAQENEEVAVSAAGENIPEDNDLDEKVGIEQTFTPKENEGIKKSFSAKLIQSADEVKVWYFEIKNCLLCYEKSNARMHWNYEKFYIGKENVATLTMRGKMLFLYLALNAEDYAGSFEVKPTVSEAFAQTPCVFRIKGPKSVKKAKELIALLMADYGVMYVKTNHSIYALPYEDDDALVAKGLAKHVDVK